MSLFKTVVSSTIGSGKMGSGNVSLLNIFFHTLLNPIWKSQKPASTFTTELVWMYILWKNENNDEKIKWSSNDVILNTRHLQTSDALWYRTLQCHCTAMPHMYVRISHTINVKVTIRKFSFYKTEKQDVHQMLRGLFSSKLSYKKR